MPNITTPGVFVEEIGRGPRPIAGVPTGTAVFLGETERGPADPRLVTGLADYTRLFGGVLAADRHLPTGVRAFFENGGRRLYIARVCGAGATTASLTLNGLALTAAGPGAWGNRIFVHLTRSSGMRPGAAGEGPVPVGFRLQVGYWNGARPEDGVDPFFGGGDPAIPAPVLAEDYDDLSLDPESPNFWAGRLPRGAPALIDVGSTEDAPAVPGDGESVGGWLVGGIDGDSPTATDFESVLARGADAFADAAILHAPGIAFDDDRQRAIQATIVAHCERVGSRFAILDAAADVSDPDDARLHPRDAIASSHAAIYHPWYRTRDAATGDERLVPPGAAVAGAYAMNDALRGVWKAPANLIVAGAIGLAADIGAGLADTLNERGVNTIRKFPGRGILIWGARTLSDDTEWKFVNIRRYFIFLETSIRNATRWTVFEPNDRPLWDAVTRSIADFLSAQWRAGGLAGRTEDEAFFVRAGRDTMTEDDILNGRLIVEIGIAPVRPAEFVILRLLQKTAEADP